MPASPGAMSASRQRGRFSSHLLALPGKGCLTTLCLRTGFAQRTLTCGLLYRSLSLCCYKNPSQTAIYTGNRHSFERREARLGI